MPEASQARGDVSVVVVAYNAAEYLERCLDSVRSYETVVVDNGSTDGTVALVRERFPAAILVEQENRGLAAGWNAGMRAASSPRHVLFLNADAWVVGDGVERLAAFADAHPRAAYVGPRLRYPDGRLQRSVRGFPTLWRLATEYLFLRKLAPRSRLLNAYYGAGFPHDRAVEAEWLMGACFLGRREALEQVGPADESFFLFGEETDWCRRLHGAGWSVWFTPDAEVVHVLGASHGGRMFRELVSAHLRFLAKHRGAAYAERARLLLAWSLWLRGRAFRGERGRTYAETARWLRSGPVPSLLRR
ncbi:MAG TPA: glycosyltransferase family 2 protein [Gaiellaceae bacterium]|nr:glycosyltransferase family 2 protein [Gaiellaceae bacterium]